MKKRQQITVEFAKALAISKNGECLSDTYVNAKSHLEWRCAEGHTWSASYDNISRGKWCPYCSGQRTNLDNLRELASEFNGKIVSAEYRGSKFKYLWECELGHRFEAIYPVVARGTWCQQCKVLRKPNPKKKIPKGKLSYAILTKEIFGEVLVGHSF